VLHSQCFAPLRERGNGRCWPSWNADLPVIDQIVGTMVGGILEELGWTGFATPTLLRRMRYGVLATGLIVGVLWGMAHLPIYYW